MGAPPRPWVVLCGAEGGRRVEKMPRVGKKPREEEEENVEET
jgi:hypothetical protein